MLSTAGGGGLLAREAAHEAEALEPYRRWRAQLPGLADQVSRSYAAEITAVAEALAGAAVTRAEVERALLVLEPLPLDVAAAVVYALGPPRITLVEQLAPGHRKHFRAQVLAAYAALEPAELAAFDQRLFDDLPLAGLHGLERMLAVIVLLELGEAALMALLADERRGARFRALLSERGRPEAVPDAAEEATVPVPDEHEILSAAAKRIDRPNAQRILEALVDLEDDALRRTLVRELDRRRRLDAVLERLPRETVLSEDSQLDLGLVLAAREDAQLARHARALMSRGAVDWSISSRESYLAVLMLRELPLAEREELALLDPAAAQLGERMRAAAGLHMLDSRAALAQREKLRERLAEPQLWTAEHVAELETLIRMATLLGARGEVFTLSKKHRADLEPGLEELVDTHGLYDEEAGREMFEPARLRRARPREAFGVTRALAGAGGALAVLARGDLYVDVETGTVGAERLPLRATQRALGKVTHGVQIAPSRGGVNRAGLSFDGRRLTLDVPTLALASVVRAGPGWSLHAGAVDASNVRLAATFESDDFSQASDVKLEFDSFKVADVVAEWRGRLVGAAELDLTGLELTGDVGIEPPRSPMRVPLLDKAIEIMLAGLYSVSLGAITRPQEIAREMLRAASQIRGLSVKLGSAIFRGVSLGAAEQATSVELRDLRAAWVGIRPDERAAGGAEIDIGSVAVRGATGAVDLPPITFEGIHAHGVAEALTFDDLSDADLVRRFLAEGPGPAREIAAEEIEATAERVTIELGEGRPPLTIGPVALASGAFAFDRETGTVTFSGADATARAVRLGALELESMQARGFRGSAELLEEGIGLRLSGVRIPWLTLRDLAWKADNGATLTSTGPVELLDVELWAEVSIDSDGVVSVAADRLDILSIEAEELRFAKGGVDLTVAAPLEVRDVRLHDVRWKPLGGVPTAAGTIGGVEGIAGGSLFSLELGGRLDMGAIEFELTEKELIFQRVDATAEAVRVGPMKAGEVDVRGLRTTITEVEGGLQFRDTVVPGLTLERIAWTTPDGRTGISGSGPVELYDLRLTATVSRDAAGVPVITADPFSVGLVEGRNLRYRNRGVDVRTQGTLEALIVSMRNVRWQPTVGLPTGTGKLGPLDSGFVGTVFGLAVDGRLHADSIEVELKEGEARLRARGVETELKAAWKRHFAELEASGVDTGTVIITPAGISFGAEGRALFAGSMVLRKLQFSSGGLTITVGGPDGLSLAGVRLVGSVQRTGDEASGLRIDELDLAELGTQSLQVECHEWSVYVTAPAALKGLVGMVRNLVAQPVVDTWEVSSYDEIRLDRLEAVGARVWIRDVPALIGSQPALKDVPWLIKPYERVVEHLIGDVKADVELPIYVAGTRIRVDNLYMPHFPIDVRVERGQVDLFEIERELQPPFVKWFVDFEIVGDRLFFQVDPFGLSPDPYEAAEWYLSSAQARRLEQELSQATGPAWAPLIPLADPRNITQDVDIDVASMQVRNIEADLTLINPQPVTLWLGTLGQVDIAPYGMHGLRFRGDLPAKGTSTLIVGLAELRIVAARDLVLAPLPRIDTGQMVMKSLRHGTVLFVDGWPKEFKAVIGVLEVDDIAIVP